MDQVLLLEADQESVGQVESQDVSSVISEGARGHFLPQHETITVSDVTDQRSELNIIIHKRKYLLIYLRTFMYKD